MDDELIRCDACQRGKHRACTVMVVVRQYRTNYMRCQCDRWEHKPPQMVTLAEAATILGVQAGTLRVQIHNGRLEGQKVGQAWVVSDREVERYARENRRPS